MAFVFLDVRTVDDAIFANDFQCVKPRPREIVVVLAFSCYQSRIPPGRWKYLSHFWLWSAYIALNEKSNHLEREIKQRWKHVVSSWTGFIGMCVRLDGHD
jgi:hypothetical protein